MQSHHSGQTAQYCFVFVFFFGVSFHTRHVLDITRNATGRTENYKNGGMPERQRWKDEDISAEQLLQSRSCRTNSVCALA